MKTLLAPALVLSLATASQAPAALPPGWPAYASAVVAADGSGQFRSLQDAIAAAPSGRLGRPWIIHIRPGTYRERLYVQREKRFLALVGESAGGHLVADAAVRMTGDTRVVAVVPFFAPVDLESDTDRRGGLSVSMRALFGRTELDEAARQALRDGSPIRRVHRGLPPFLLVHGTADMSVLYEQSVRMQKALHDASVTCDLITVPDGTHGTREWDERLPGYADQVVAWLVERIGR